jgi:single-strand DNA-binding protein
MPFSDINHVVLVGRLTKDPELRPLPEGSVCGLRVVCNTTRRGAEGKEERPNYFDVSVFGAQVESISRYTHKGSRVAIAGRLEWREWETTDQQKRQAVKIVANSVQFLDSPGDRSATSGARDEMPSIEFDGIDELDGGDELAGDELVSGESWESQGIDLRPARDLIGVGAGAEEEDLIGVGAGADEEDLNF